MPPALSRIWPWLFALLVVFLLYRRFRRNFGRQLLLPTRMTVRVVLLIVLAAVLAPMGLRGGDYALAEMSGLALGIALALWGASRTRYVREGGRLFYIPHTYTGIAVSALVLGRIVYRLAVTYPTGGPPMPGAPGGPGAAGAMVKTPLTLGLFFVLIGYYVCYYSRVIWKSKRITSADLEASATRSEPAA
jgi:hypothetical protein